MYTILIETEKGSYPYESSIIPAKGDCVKLLNVDLIFITKVTHFPELKKVNLAGTFEKPTSKKK